MDIDWFAARQLMLTSAEVFSSPPWKKTVGSLDAVIYPEQVNIAERCLRALYQGLQWASKYEIKLKNSKSPGLARHFLIEDEQVIGIFRDCFRSGAHSYADFKYPTSLQEYIELQTEGRSFIVADLVLEKPNLRLVNRWGSNRQSKFLRDLVLPGLMGIGAHYAGWVERLEGEGREAGWQGCDRAAAAESLAQVELGKLLTRELLFDSCYNVAASDIFLSDHSPLVLFYDASSPLNVDLSRVDPWMAPWTAPKELSYLGDCCPGDFRANVTGMQPFPQSPPTP